MKLLTFQDIVDMYPCEKHSPSKYVPETWTGTILDVLNLPNVAPAEKLWVACRVLDDKVLRLFAVDCARRALSKIDEPDARSLAAVDVAEAFAHGNATTEELKTAYTAAAIAAYTAAYSSADATAAHAAAHAAAITAATTAAHAAAHATATSADTTAYAYTAADATAAHATATSADTSVTAAHATATSADTTAYAYTAADATAALKEREIQIEQLIKLIPEYADTDTI